MERDNPSPEPMVYLFMSVRLPPLQNSPPPYEMGKHKVTVHGAPRTQKAYMQWGVAWFPKGIVYETIVSTPVSGNLLQDTFHCGLGRPEPR